MDVIERLQKIIDEEGLTIPAFARKIGVVDQTIRGIVVQKRNKPGYDVLVKILQTFNWINAEWLITGKGEMRKSNPEENSEDSQQLIELIKYLREKDEKIEKLIEEKTELRIKYDIMSNELEKRSRRN